MNKSEQVIVDVFITSTAISKDEIMAAAEEQITRVQVAQAYTNLVAKGILAEDDYGVVTLSRKRLAEYDVLYPLLDVADDDF